VEGGRARLRKIEVGHRSGLAAEILSGLQEGATVIVHPGDTIADGTRVKSRKP
jgi:HlyD family secretion protein